MRLRPIKRFKNSYPIPVFPVWTIYNTSVEIYLEGVLALTRALFE